MLARNHETSAFACVTLASTAVGVPWPGALVLGVLGAWAGDWPDIDHASATVTRSLRWIPYWIDFARDKKTGDYKRKKPGKGWFYRTYVWKARCFPAVQVHGFCCWLSGAIYDRCATALDRADKNKLWGPAFRVHRGFTHSVWCAGLTGLAWWAAAAPWIDLWSTYTPIFGTPDFPVLLGATLALGMLTHIGGDACTDFGVSPFAPLIKVNGRRYPRLALLPEPLRFKVNKSVELILIAPLCVALAGYSVLGAVFGAQNVLEGVVTLVGRVWSSLA
jgi:membrane-bound metal-dependent hydrolase YbcI (DUF457 family)